MVLRSETPPSPGNLSVEAPPASGEPTTAMLKADIDSGRTGDKVEHYDAGMAQLGTCDEAAGTPPSPGRVALARESEATARGAGRSDAVQGNGRWVLPAFFGFIAAVPVIIGLALWLAR